MNIVEIKMELIKKINTLMKENNLEFTQETTSFHVNRFLSDLPYEITDSKEVTIHLDKKNISLSIFRKILVIRVKEKED